MSNVDAVAENPGLSLRSKMDVVMAISQYIDGTSMTPEQKDWLYGFLYRQVRSFNYLTVMNQATLDDFCSDVLAAFDLVDVIDGSYAAESFDGLKDFVRGLIGNFRDDSHFGEKFECMTGSKKKVDGNSGEISYEMVAFGDVPSSEVLDFLEGGYDPNSIAINDFLGRVFVDKASLTLSEQERQLYYENAIKYYERVLDLMGNEQGFSEYISTSPAQFLRANILANLTLHCSNMFKNLSDGIFVDSGSNSMIPEYEAKTRMYFNLLRSWLEHKKGFAQSLSYSIVFVLLNLGEIDEADEVLKEIITFPDSDPKRVLELSCYVHAMKLVNMLKGLEPSANNMILTNNLEEIGMEVNRALKEALDRINGVEEV